MKAQSGTSSDSYISQMASSNSSTGGAAVAPTPDDPSASFDDALTQQGVPPAPTSPPPDWQSIIASLPGKTPDVAASIPVPTTPAATVPADPALPEAPPEADPITGAPLPKTQLPKGHTQPKTAEPATSTTPAATAPTTPTKTTSATPLYTGASSFMAHAAILAAQARQTPAATPDAEPETDADTETSAQATTTLADEFSLAAPLPKVMAKSMGTSGAPATEKKSDFSSSQGSFLQPDSSTGMTSWMLLGAVGHSLATNAQASGNQTVANHSGATGTPIDGASGSASGPAGMANGKKEKDMNATLDLSDMAVSTATNTVVTKNSADVNIQLGTNQTFKDALSQIMRVAELSGMSSTTPPLRVAIEIQTPPGAIVNVYVSKQDDGYRAQLSATDPQALSYVQDQISTLRQSTDTGVTVRWLPAQLETSSSISAGSSSNDSGLSWDRGGQNQQGSQQQSDERQQAQQQRKPLFDGQLPPSRSNTFTDTFGLLGRSA